MKDEVKNSKNVKTMKTKKIYVSPMAEVYDVQLDMVCESLGLYSTTSITDENKGSFTKAANERQVIHEDGLRDWNIDLW